MDKESNFLGRNTVYMRAQDRVENIKREMNSTESGVRYKKLTLDYQKARSRLGTIKKNMDMHPMRYLKSIGSKLRKIKL